MPTSLLEEKTAGRPVIHVSGYLWELERRGYLQAGAFVPEVVLEHPEVLEQAHRDYAHAGADTTLAFTYYGHREKLRLIGKEDLLEPMNKNALALAKKVAEETNTIFTGNICNTNIYEEDKPETLQECRKMFDESIGWAKDAGVDFILGETFSFLAEARIALQAIKAAGLPAVIGFSVPRAGKLRDHDSVAEACEILYDEGADMVGVNCARGPQTILPLVQEIAQHIPPEAVAAFPVAYRTHEGEPTFQCLTDQSNPCMHMAPLESPFPVALDHLGATRYEMADFATSCADLGVGFIGGCCGVSPHHVREMAEALGRNVPASRYAPDMSKHFSMGSDPSLKTSNQEFYKEQ